jgi:hypothetical protein
MRTIVVVTSMVFLIMLSLPFVNCQRIQTYTNTLESRTLAYVENVLPFEMNHYSITVGDAYCLSLPNDTTLTQAVDATLDSIDTTIHVVCVYVNGSLDQCGVTPTAGTPVSDRNYISMEEAVARILLAHQQQTGRDSTALLNTLNRVNITQATPVTSGNVSFTIKHFPDLVGSQIINGIPVPVASNSSFSTTFHWLFPDCSVTMTFYHGIFCSLQDWRALNPAYDLGSNQNQVAVIASTTSIATQLINKQQNNAEFPLLIAAGAAYVAVLIVMLTYKAKNKEEKQK